MSNNIRKSYSGGVVDSQLNGLISASATSITVDDGSSFPTGASFPFVICIGLGTATEEKCLVTRGGNVFTVTTRGYDGTTASIHADNTPVTHVLDAFSIEQANYMANIMTTTGDILYKASSSTYGRLAIGVAGQVVSLASGIPAWVNGYTSGVAANRPSGADGMTYWATDTNTLSAHDGTGWIILEEPEQSYTPAFTGVTLGTGSTRTGTYQRGNGRVDWYAAVILGTGGVLTGAVTVSTPMAFAAHSRYTWPAMVTDATVNNYRALTNGTSAGGTTLGVYSPNGAVPTENAIDLGATAPFTWTVNDKIEVWGRAKMNTKYL